MNHKEYEERRRALFRYQHLVRRLEQVCREAGRWTTMAIGSGVDMMSGPRNSVTSTAAILHQEVERLGDATIHTRAELLAAFSQLTNETEREVMESRYITGMSVRQIGETYGYTNRHVNRLLESATAALAWPIGEHVSNVPECPKDVPNVPECPIETATVIDV